MQTQVAVKNRGLTVGVALTVAAAPSAAALARDDAGKRVEKVLAQAAQRISDILVVATQDVIRDAIAAALVSAGLPVVRVEVDDVAPLQARAHLGYPFGDVRLVTEDQQAAADQLIADYAASFAAQE
jgi:hypothetical protein